MQLGLLTDMQFSCPTGMTGSFARGGTFDIILFFLLMLCPTILSYTLGYFRITIEHRVGIVLNFLLREI